MGSLSLPLWRGEVGPLLLYWYNTVGERGKVRLLKVRLRERARCKLEEMKREEKEER